MSNVPKQTLAEKVRKSLEQEIITGKYELGSKIPPETLLVQQFQVGRNTVREAVQSLIHLGLLEARQGSGTYVIAKDHFTASMMTLCQNVNNDDYNEFKNLLGRFILKNLSKGFDGDLGKVEDCYLELKKFYRSNLQEVNKDIEEVKQNVKSKNLKKLKKKDEMLMKSTSFSTKEVIDFKQDLLIDKDLLSQFQLLESHFLNSLVNCSHNKMISSVFNALNFSFKIKPSFNELQKLMKQYDLLAEALMNKNSKAIKKLADSLFP